MSFYKGLSKAMLPENCLLRHLVTEATIDSFTDDNNFQLKKNGYWLANAKIGERLFNDGPVNFWSVKSKN